MIIIVVLAVIILLVLIISKTGTGDSGQSSQQPSAPRRQPSTSRSVSVVRAPTQAEYNRAREADRIASQQARRSRTARDNVNLSTIGSAMRDIEISFVDQQGNLAGESERLEGQLQRLMAQRLQEGNFQQYIQLHHASRDAADKRYEAWQKSKVSLDKIGKVIVGIGKGTIRASESERQYAYLLKDAIKACRDANKENTLLLNNQTHVFKIKIRDECGAGGRNWYEQIESRNARSRNSRSWG